jgi:hypothetical protein
VRPVAWRRPDIHRLRLYHGLLLILERFTHTQWNWRPGVFGIASSFILLIIPFADASCRGALSGGHDGGIVEAQARQTIEWREGKKVGITAWPVEPEPCLFVRSAGGQQVQPLHLFSLLILAALGSVRIREQPQEGAAV